MGRSPCCDESGLKKGPWTPEEDDKLIKYITKHGHGSWRALPKLAGLNRCGKSCRLRWTNYLRPDIKRGKFSHEEEQTILNLHAVLGNKWSAIATHLPGRTDNEIKNFWNTHLKKKLISMGFDPMTHRPRTDIFSTLPHLIALANLIENPTWEEQAARLQSEAVQMARLNHCLQYILQQPPPPPQPLASFQTTSVGSGTGVVPAGLPDMSALSFLSQLEPPALAGYLHESAPFSHLPELHAPGGDGVQASLTKGGAGGAVITDDSPAGSSSQWLRPMMAETSVTNTGDACSTSSCYGGAQIWSELLDDPLFNEIA